MLIHSHNTPPPNTCTHSLLKNEFSQHTHLPLQGTHMVPLQQWGRAHCLWQRSAAGCPSYSGSHPATFAQGLPKKRVFPGYPPGGSRYPHGPSIIPMGSHPYAWPRSHWGHTHTPPPPTLVPTVSFKNEFSQHTHPLQGTHMVPTHGVRPRRLAPVRSAAGCPKTLFWVPPGHFRPRSP